MYYKYSILINDKHIANSFIINNAERPNIKLRKTKKQDNKLKVLSSEKLIVTTRRL